MGPTGFLEMLVTNSQPMLHFIPEETTTTSKQKPEILLNQIIYTHSIAQ